MVSTIKFSEMTDGGDIANNDKVPGLLAGGNVLFNNPWTFLPPGSTADRPTPSSEINYRLRYNTTDDLYEYYDATLSQWTQLQESLFTTGPLLIYEAASSFPDAFNLGALTTGILKQTVSLGVATPSIADNGVDYYGPGFSGYFQSPKGVNDANGNIVVEYQGHASAVNYLRFDNNPTGLGPTIYSTGSDTNVSLGFVMKGTGTAYFNTLNNIPINFTTGTGYQHTTVFQFSDTLANRTVTFQDANGTVAYLSDIPAGTPSALTKTDDTNVTLTLGGTPSTALLQAVSMTLGWTGQLSVARGGTGLAALTAHYLPIGNGTTALTLLAPSATSGTTVCRARRDQRRDRLRTSRLTAMYWRHWSSPIPSRIAIQSTAPVDVRNGHSM